MGMNLERSPLPFPLFNELLRLVFVGREFCFFSSTTVIYGAQASITRKAMTIFEIRNFQLSQDNADHFCKCPTWTSYGGRIIDCCTELKDAMPKLQGTVVKR